MLVRWKSNRYRRHRAGGSLPTLGCAVLALLSVGFAPMPRPMAALPASETPDATGVSTDMDLGYTVYAGGLPLVRASLTLDLSPERYSADFSAQGSRIVDFLTRWSFEAEAEGMVATGAVAPQRYHSDRRIRGKRQTGTLVYDEDGRVEASADPPRSREDTNAVPAELRPETVDPLSAAVALIHGMAETGRCAGTIPVYDGRRRYDIVASGGEHEHLGASSYALYEGPAMRCDIRLVPVAGFKAGDGSDFWDGNGPADRRRASVWLAQPRPAAPPVPVRILADSAIGPLIIHLTDVN